MKTSKYLIVSAFLALSFVAPAFAQTPYPGYQAYPSYPTYPAQSACPQLTYNLYRGLSDYNTAGQVSQLQYFLGNYFAAEPVPVTGYYGSITTSFVARFQQQQGVYPITGGVGPLTRAAIARVCGGVTIVPPPSYGGGVSITNVSGPNSLAAGSSGTWSITTNAPYGSYLSVSVRWGDENIYPYTTSPQAPSYISQQNTFSHTYYQAGTYTITFTVTDGTGRATSANTTVVVGSGTGCYYPYYTNCQSSITITSPSAGQTYTRGSQMPITWSGSSDGYSSASTVIDLYSVSGGKVGAIATQSGASGSYTWTIPTYSGYYGGQYCTMQYPNPQCINVPDGHYYIKATLVAGSGFGGGTTLASANSGTFTITGGGGGGSYNVTAYPTSGYAPLMVTFTVNNYSGQYSVSFGDGTSATLQSGTVTHAYYNRGTFTAQFATDYTCLHGTPTCTIAVQNLGSATITVY